MQRYDWTPRFMGALSTGMYYLVTEVDAEIERLTKFQAVCHCGALAKDHGLLDGGHTAVPMTEPCPYVEELVSLQSRIKALEDALKEVKRLDKLCPETEGIDIQAVIDNVLKGCKEWP